MHKFRTIEDADSPGTEFSIFRCKSVHHYPVCLQKIINRQRIQLWHEIVCPAGIPDLRYFISAANDMLPVNYRRDLFQ